MTPLWTIARWRADRSDFDTLDLAFDLGEARKLKRERDGEPRVELLFRAMPATPPRHEHDEF